MSSVDLWLISLGNDDPEAVLRSFALAFDVPLEKAREMTARLPRVVHRDTTEEEGALLAERLTALGAVVAVRPSAPAIELAPGSRPSRDSQPVPAAPPLSLFPRPHAKRHSTRPHPKRHSSRPPPMGDATDPPVSRLRRVSGLVGVVAGIVLLVATGAHPAIGVLAIIVGIVLIGP